MKRICIFTSTRADFGILRPLAEELRKRSKDFHVEFFVTGTHLSQEHGCTVQEIEDAGFAPKHRVSIFDKNSEAGNHSEIMGKALGLFGRELSGQNYDLAVILGDRFEALSFGLACFNRHLPIVHIHGGEVTLGALDDGYRHALTKISQIHFACTDTYRDRIIRMGEHPERVFNVGALAIDNIKKLPVLSKEELESDLKVRLREKIILMTFHPETTSSDFGLGKLENLIGALRDEKFKTWTILLTGTNKDHGSERIRARLFDWANEDNRVIYVESLGAKNYFSMVRHSQLVVGNSSSGVIEVPSMGVPTVNIGTRQDGRLRSESIIDVPGNTSDEVLLALKEAIKMKDSGKIGSKPVYGDGSASVKIADILQTLEGSNLRHKGFYDGH